MPSHQPRAFIPLVCLLAIGCGSSNTSSTNSSPLDDLTSRLPAPARLVTDLGGSSTTDAASAALSLLRTSLDNIDGLRTTWCHGKASATAGSIVVAGSTPVDSSLTGGTYAGLSITRMVAAGPSSCTSTSLPAFWIRLDIVGYDADGVALPPPWRNSTRLDRVLLFGRVATSADAIASDTIAQQDLAFVLMTGQPTTALDAADDWAHLPAIPSGLESLDNGHLTAVFFPQQILAAGVGFGDNSTLPEVLTMVVDLSASTTRSHLCLLKWTTANGQPLAIDLRVEDGIGITGAAVFDSGGTPTLRTAFFVNLRAASLRSGFAIDGADPTNLDEAWDTNGDVTFDTSTQGGYTLPTDFQGWPGVSSTWTVAFGQGLSTQFTTALNAAAAVNTWFGN